MYFSTVVGKTVTCINLGLPPPSYFLTILTIRFVSLTKTIHDHGHMNHRWSQSEPKKYEMREVVKCNKNDIHMIQKISTAATFYTSCKYSVYHEQSNSRKVSNVGLTTIKKYNHIRQQFLGFWYKLWMLFCLIVKMNKFGEQTCIFFYLTCHCQYISSNY